MPQACPGPAHHLWSRDLLGKRRAVPLYLSPGLFFCLTSVISNRHEMTIKGFFNESHFYWLGFLGLLVQLSRACPGTEGLSHKVTIHRCELDSDTAPAPPGPARLMVKEGGSGRRF